MLRLIALDVEKQLESITVRKLYVERERDVRAGRHAGDVGGLREQGVAVAQRRNLRVGIVDGRAAGILNRICRRESSVAGGAGAVVRGAAQHELQQTGVHPGQLGADRNSVVGRGGRDRVDAVGQIRSVCEPRGWLILI